MSKRYASIHHRLDAIEERLSKDGELPFEWDGYHVTVTNYLSFYKLVLEWLKDGWLSWGKKSACSPNIGFSGGAKYHDYVSTSGKISEEITNAGYALEGAFESCDDGVKPQSTEEMIEVLEMVVDELAQKSGG